MSEFVITGSSPHNVTLTNLYIVNEMMVNNVWRAQLSVNGQNCGMFPEIDPKDPIHVYNGTINSPECIDALCPMVVAGQATPTLVLFQVDSPL